MCCSNSRINIAASYILHKILLFEWHEIYQPYMTRKYVKKEFDNYFFLLLGIKAAADYRHRRTEMNH